MSFLLLLVIPGFILYLMSPEERLRFLRVVQDRLERAVDAVRQRRAERDPFRDALRARTPWLLVTPALVGVNATIFVCMLFGAGALGDPQTLLAWGGNFGPRTTSGEWWRLVTATFVHSGMMHLLVNVACLAQVGFALERQVGPFAFASTYVTAGVFASLVSLSAYPMSIAAGASGAIFGVYGLLLASSVWSMRQRSDVTMPLTAVKRFVPVAVVFILYNLTSDSLDAAAELSGLVTGLVCGLMLSRGVSDRKPRAAHVAAAIATTVMIAVVSSARLRGIADVRPEIARVVAVEQRTASAYDNAVAKFRIGRVTADALIRVIERTIIPELQATRSRLEAIDGVVPPEHQPLVAAAGEYLRLRDESWRLRAEALHKGSMVTLRGADRTERASLEAFKKISGG